MTILGPSFINQPTNRVAAVALCLELLLLVGWLGGSPFRQALQVRRVRTHVVVIGYLRSRCRMVQPSATAFGQWVWPKASNNGKVFAKLFAQVGGF